MRPSLPQQAQRQSRTVPILARRREQVLSRAVRDRVADWAASNGRTVEITVDGSTLKVSKVSREEQRQLIDAYLARLAAGGTASYS